MTKRTDEYALYRAIDETRALAEQDPMLSSNIARELGTMTVARAGSGRFCWAETSNGYRLAPSASGRWCVYNAGQNPGVEYVAPNLGDAVIYALA